MEPTQRKRGQELERGAEFLDQAIPEESPALDFSVPGIDHSPISLPIMQGYKLLLLGCYGDLGNSHYFLRPSYLPATVLRDAVSIISFIPHNSSRRTVLC